MLEQNIEKKADYSRAINLIAISNKKHPDKTMRGECNLKGAILAVF